MDGLHDEVGNEFGRRARRGRPLRLHFVVLVGLGVLAAAANVAYQRHAAIEDARRAATSDAQFAAKVAAREIQSAIDLVRSTVADTAATPGLDAALEGSTPCQLTFGQSGVVSSGHIDVIGADGAVGCTSLADPQSGYAEAGWLTAAMARPQVIGPVLDERTGTDVVLISAPFGGVGAVVVFFDLEGVGEQLATEFGGPRQLEFLVTNADTDRVLTRTIDAARWIGAPTAGTPFDTTGDTTGNTTGNTTGGTARHDDLDGNTRLYGEATVAGQNWTVFAGADESEALTAAERMSSRQLAITAAVLLVVLGAAFVLYGRVVRPIRALSASAQAAAARTSLEPIAVRGPAEISDLVDDFNHLVDVANGELQASSRLTAMVESSADAIIGKSLDDVVISWNAAAATMFGYTADEIVGSNVDLILPPDRVEEEVSILQRVAAGENIEQLETKRVRKDGTVVDVSMTISPVRDAGGAIIGLSTVSRDITERNRVEAEHRLLADRVGQSERLESVGQLAGGIAHDFNNLLGVILNYATFVGSQTEDRPAVQADVMQIRLAAERAARLTRQLLTFARRETITTESLDLNEIVAEVNNLLSRTIGEHIDLVVRLGEAPHRILADRGQIEQILLNLAINARDAMPDGGALTIETGHVDLDEGYAHMHPDAVPGRYVQLSVSDTGTGMSPDIASRIFEPFFTTKPAGHGTGLGLATVHGIVTKSGGTMSVYSELGLGTTFRLYFPVTEQPAAVATTSRPKARGHGETILVVEDEPAVLELTARILRHEGYQVLEAQTFEAAAKLAATKDFDMLLTDSVMPGVSGRVLAQHIVTVKPGTPVLFMSGYSEGVVVPQGLLPNNAALIHKPFDRHTLITAVQTALSRPVARELVSRALRGQ